MLTQNEHFQAFAGAIGALVGRRYWRFLEWLGEDPALQVVGPYVAGAIIAGCVLAAIVAIGITYSPVWAALAAIALGGALMLAWQGHEVTGR